jgi:hypothetical protein
MVDGGVLIESHGVCAALLERGIPLHLLQVFLVGHAGWHGRMLRATGHGHGDGNNGAEQAHMDSSP